ncbi:hypothetical protein Tco_0082147, partial [Tanacetum coccineum]
IVTKLEQHHKDPDSQKPISESTLHALQKVIDYTIDELSSKNLSISSSIIPSLTSAMESGGPQHSLLASKVYLSFLFTPNSNVISLFTPMVYFAPSATLLRIVHRVDRLVKQRGDEGQGQGRAMMRWKQVKSLHVLDYILFWVWFISTCFLIVWLKAIVHTVSEILVMALESCGNLSNYNKSCSLCSEILSELLIITVA